MDAIIIRDLEVSCCIGVTETERATPQKLLLTAEMATDVTTAAAKDELRWSIDYETVCRRMEGITRERAWNLIEALAVELADTIMREFGPLSVSVEVKKFALRQTAFVSVRVTRPQ